MAELKLANSLPDEAIRFHLDIRDTPPAAMTLELATAVLSDLERVAGDAEIFFQIDYVSRGSLILQFLAENFDRAVGLAGLAASIVGLWRSGGGSAPKLLSQTLNVFRGTVVNVYVFPMDEPQPVTIDELPSPDGPVQLPQRPRQTVEAAGSLGENRSFGQVVERNGKRSFLFANGNSVQIVDEPEDRAPIGVPLIVDIRAQLDATGNYDSSIAELSGWEQVQLPPPRLRQEVVLLEGKFDGGQDAAFFDAGAAGKFHIRNAGAPGDASKRRWAITGWRDSSAETDGTRVISAFQMIPLDGPL